MNEEDHTMERSMTLLDSHGALVVVICSCGEKCKGRSTREAEQAQFQHMLSKARDGEVPF